MQSTIAVFVDAHSGVIERALEAELPVSSLEGTNRLNHAIRYAVLGGGKRMRPVLALLAGRLCGAAVEDVLPAACAVEYLHACSLALDDLPAMDDAGLRRGRATLHVAFGEDTAILASLALLNKAYALFARVPGLLPDAVEAIGTAGMVGGQAADLAGAPAGSRIEKTTALTRLTLAAGARSARAGEAEVAALVEYGDHLGAAYQICDDLADELTGDAPGKTAGQDRRLGRRSFAWELGPARAGLRARELAEAACSALRARFVRSPDVALLEQYARSIPGAAMALVERSLPLAV